MNKKKIIICTIFVFLLILIGIIVYININNDISYEIEKIDKWKYFSLMQDGKIGVIDSSGNIIIEPKYDSIEIPNPTKPVFFCVEGKEEAILNEKNEIIFTEYDEVENIKLEELAIDIPYEKTVLIYKKDGKYGLINFEGKKITNAKYDTIESLPYKEGVLLVKKKGKYGLINIKGKTILKEKYYQINADSYVEEDNDYSYSGYIASKQTKNGLRYEYIDYKGKKNSKLKDCENIKRINEIQEKNQVYIIYQVDGKYGVLKNNKKIIQNNFDTIGYDELNQLFITQKDGKYGVCNIEGKTILENIYDSIEPEGIYLYVEKDSNQIKLDINGNEINNNFKSEYKIENTPYSIVLTDEDIYGVKENNQQIIPSDYFYIEYIGHDYFIAVLRNGKSGIINKNNKPVIELNNDMTSKIDDTNIIQIYNPDTNKCYLYNDKLEKIDEMEDAKVDIEKDYIKLYSNRELKYFSKDGNQINSKEALSDRELLADVKAGRWGFIDRNGNSKVEYKYEYVTEFNKYGYAGIKENGKWGSIDMQGNVVAEPQYNINLDNTSIDFIGKYYKKIYGYLKFYYTDYKYGDE